MRLCFAIARLKIVRGSPCAVSRAFPGAGGGFDHKDKVERLRRMRVAASTRVAGPLDHKKRSTAVRA
jgi:hypothetical protein